MKKMVCDICDSQRIKKENGVFVCQDCGTEYSLEEARNLLKEVDVNANGSMNNNVTINDTQNISNSNVSIINNKENKYILLKRLYAWAQVIPVFDEVPFWFSGNYSLSCATDEKNFLKLKKDLKTIKKRDFYDIDVKFVKYLFANDYDYYSEDYLGVVRKMLKFFSDIYDYNCCDENKTDVTIEKWQSQLFEDNSLYNKCRDKLLRSHEFFDQNGNKYEKFIAVNNKTGKNYNLNSDTFSCDPDGRVALYEFSKNIDSIDIYENVKETIELPRKWYQPAEYRIQVKKVKTTEIDFVREYCKFVNEFILQIKNRHKEIKEYYNKNFDDIKIMYIDACELVCQLENEFNLPYEYRNIDTIIKLIKIIEEGRADNWKEVINLFKSDQFSTRIITGISELKNELYNISDKLTKIHSQLVSLDSNISNISAKMDESNNILNKLSSTASKIFEQTLESKQMLRQIMYDTRRSLIWK